MSSVSSSAFVLAFAGIETGPSPVSLSHIPSPFWFFLLSQGLIKLLRQYWNSRWSYISPPEYQAPGTWHSLGLVTALQGLFQKTATLEMRI